MFSLASHRTLSRTSLLPLIVVVARFATSCGVESISVFDLSFFVRNMLFIVLGIYLTCQRCFTLLICVFVTLPREYKTQCKWRSCERVIERQLYTELLNVYYRLLSEL